MPKWLTIDEYAKLKNKSRRTIMNWKREGKIKTKKEVVIVEQKQTMVFVEVEEDND